MCYFENRGPKSQVCETWVAKSININKKIIWASSNYKYYLCTNFRIRTKNLCTINVDLEIRDKNWFQPALVC